MVIRSRPCKPSAPPRGRRVFWFCRIERCACRDSALPLPGRRCPWATEARPFRAGGARRLRDERALGAGKHAREDRRVHRARLGVWQSGRSAAERLLGALHADDHADGAGAVPVLRADRRRGAIVGGRGAGDRRVASDAGADDLHDDAGSGAGSHTLRLEYYNGDGPATLRLAWQDMATAILGPAEALGPGT